MPQLFDPNKFTVEQMQSLQNIPGQSLADTNTAGLIQSVQDNPNVITPSNLTATGQYGIVDPVKDQIPDISTLGDTQDQTLTPQEQTYFDLSKKVQQQNTELAGKAGYQAQQDTLAGVDTAQQAYDDLSIQLKGLQNEAKAIPLQLQNNSAGATTFAMGVATDAALRTNAIKALTVSTLMDASKGMLDSAQKKADRAVSLKYDQLEAERDANIKNLELIKSDPLTTLQERNRADKQIALQEKAKEQIAQDKQNATDVWKVAVDASSNINEFTPTADFKTVTQALTAISNAKTPQEALQISVQTGLIKQSTVQPKILGSASTGYFTYDPNTGITTPLGKHPTPTTPTTPKTTFNSASSNLKKQAIPVTALLKDGSMATKYQKELLNAGLDQTQIDWMWSEVVGGTSFEDIRQEMTSKGADPKILDTFVQALQA